MASERLQRLYQEKHLEIGCSEEVDESITALCELALAPGLQVLYEQFAKRWQDFLAAVISNFPNISVPNLKFTSTMLVEARLFKEELYVRHLLVELQPENDEAHCSLGQAYKRIDRYDLALPCFQTAYQLASGRAEAQQLGADDPVRLAACDYRAYVAGCQLYLRQYPAALASITTAISIIRKAGDTESSLAKNLIDLLVSVMDKADWRKDEEFEIDL